MPQVYLDTNILVRFLTQDDDQKANAILTFLETSQVFLADLILAETFYVLHKAYKISRNTVIDHLHDILLLDNIQCNRTLLTKTLEYMRESKLDFQDAYLTALARTTNGKVLSYDKDIKDDVRVKP